MLHEQAIYQHDGECWQVERFDYENHKAFVRKVEPDYWTDAMTYAQVSVLEESATGAARLRRARGRRGWGEVSVVEKVVGYKKIKFYTHENAGYGDVRLPEMQMHTTAFWLTVPGGASAQRDPAGARGGHRRRCAASASRSRRWRRSRSCAIRAISGRTLGDTALDDGRRDGGRRLPRSRARSAAARSPATARRSSSTSTSPGASASPSASGSSATSLVARALRLVERCPCPGGCPACVGPGESPRKTVAVELLRASRAYGLNGRAPSARRRRAGLAVGRVRRLLGRAGGLGARGLKTSGTREAEELRSTRPRPRPGRRAGSTGRSRNGGLVLLEHRVPDELQRPAADEEPSRDGGLTTAVGIDATIIGMPTMCVSLVPSLVCSCWYWARYSRRDRWGREAHGAHRRTDAAMRKAPGPSCGEHSRIDCTPGFAYPMRVRMRTLAQRARRVGARHAGGRGLPARDGTGAQPRTSTTPGPLPRRTLGDDGGSRGWTSNLGAPFAVTGLQPSHGPWTGGTRTSIAGRGFSSKLHVWIGATQLAAERRLRQRSHAASPSSRPPARPVRPTSACATSRRRRRRTLPAGFFYDAFVGDARHRRDERRHAHRAQGQRHPAGRAARPSPSAASRARHVAFTDATDLDVHDARERRRLAET